MYKSKIQIVRLFLCQIYLFARIRVLNSMQLLFLQRRNQYIGHHEDYG